MLKLNDLITAVESLSNGYRKGLSWDLSGKCKLNRSMGLVDQSGLCGSLVWVNHSVKYHSLSGSVSE